MERTLPWAWYTDPGVLRREEERIFARAVGHEDTALVEGVQRGIRTGLLAEGRLLSESKQLVAHFQRLCAEALSE